MLGGGWTTEIGSEPGKRLLKASIQSLVELGLDPRFAGLFFLSLPPLGLLFGAASIFEAGIGDLAKARLSPLFHCGVSPNVHV